MPYLQNLRACASAFMVFVRKFTAKISISEDTMIHTRTHRLYGASRMTRLKQLLYSEQKSSSKKKERSQTVNVKPLRIPPSFPNRHHHHHHIRSIFRYSDSVCPCLCHVPVHISFAHIAFYF